MRENDFVNRVNVYAQSAYVLHQNIAFPSRVKKDLSVARGDEKGFSMSTPKVLSRQSLVVVNVQYLDFHHWPPQSTLIWLRI
jgi:hypothetical protein